MKITEMRFLNVDIIDTIHVTEHC